MIRVATYNIEWFNNLFDRHDRLQADGDWSARWDITRKAQADALGRVFLAMDADAIMIIEAPDHSAKRNAVKALSGFAETYGIRANAAVIGFSNDTQQEIALLYDPQVLTVSHAPHPGTQDAPRFDQVYSIDLDIDATEDQVVFSKPPLELSVQTRSGFEMRMIGAHLKSKAPHGATNDAEVMSFAIANRRKQLA
ncbi:MAG: endonuclease, partial [Sulfitobacter sp.]